MNPSPNTEERIWAILSHLSALAFGMGIVLPILGWSEQRNKSRYASFQCLQALGYQSLGYTIWLLSYLVLALLYPILLVFAAARMAENDNAILLWVGGFMLIVLGFLGVYLLLPVIAAIACAFGKDFHYPIMGKRLAKYLGYETSNETDPSISLNQEHEEHWVAAMGHFSVIIALWGLIAPAATWILQGKHSAFLKFQSIQTTIYQGIVNLLYLAAGGVYFLGLIPILVVIAVTRGSGTDAPAGIFSLIVLFLSLLISAFVVLAIPLFHILGQWAGYRLLKGENYRYPLLGKLVERRLAKSSGV